MKKIFVFLLMLFMICLPAVAENAYLVSMGEYPVLVSESAGLITQPGQYAKIHPAYMNVNLCDAQYFYAARPQDMHTTSHEYYGETYYEGYYLYALMDAQGNVLSDFLYSAFTVYPDFGIAVFSAPDDICGVMDLNGNELFRCKAGDIVPTGENTYLVAKPDGPEEHRLHLIDTQGQWQNLGIRMRSDRLSSYEYGVMRVRCIKNGNNRYALVNTRGEMITPAQFSSIDSFYNGLAVCQLADNHLYGIINTAGEWVIPAQFMLLSYYDNYGHPIYIGRRSDNTCAVYDENANLLFAPDASAYTEGFFIKPRAGMVEIRGWYDSPLPIAMYDLSGDIVFTYDEGNPSDNYVRCEGTPGRLIVSTGEWPNEEYFLIDMQGRRIGDAAFQNIQSAVWQDDHGRFIFGVFETELVHEDEDGTRHFSYVSDSRFYGMIDENANVILPAQYTMIESVDVNRFWVKRGSQYGLLDENGNWLITLSEYMLLMD